MPRTDDDIYLGMFYRRLMRLGREIGRYKIDRREVEGRGDKTGIRQLEDKHMQVLLSLWYEAGGLLSLISETVKDAVRVSEAKTGFQHFDNEIQALLTVCLHTLPLDTLLEAPKGHFWADLAIMYSGTKSNESRIEAADRLFANYFKKPIYWKRWRAIEATIMKEIVRAAAIHNISSRKEFRRRKRSSLYMVARGVVTGFKIREQNEAIRAVKAALNNALTEDILGSDWRKKPDQRKFEDQGSKKPIKKSQTEVLRKSSEAKVLREVEIKALLKSKALTERDVQILSARLRNVPHAELAAKLAINPEALRTAHHRAIEKLKKLVS